MALDGLIIDVDGTLVDSNAVHVRAWQRVFAEQGFKISPDRIFVEVGQGGDNLVPAILGEQADREHGEVLRKGEPREFLNIIAKEGLRPFPGAAELLQELRRRKIATAIASSGDRKGLDGIERASGVQWSKRVDYTITADDVERSKPDPDLIHASLSRLRLGPAQCAMLGDTPHDAEAALRAGVVCIGVQSGGHNRNTLLLRGARLVYRDTADLLDNLEDALHRASPGKAHLTPDVLEKLLRQAIEVARQAMKAGEAPIGCVLADGNARIIATGFNQQNSTQNKIAHAEVVTFGNAAGKVPQDSRDLVLACTLEPCVMCTGAAMEAAVDTIAFGLPAPADQGTHRVTPPTSPESQMPRIIGNILANECRELFKQFLATNPGNPAQVKYVKQLLEGKAD